MKKTLLYIIFVILLLPVLQAQAPNGTLKLTPDDGLISAHVNNIQMDHKGFVWIATNSLLIRFDSKTMKRYLKGNGLATGIHNIFEDSKHNL